jgi:hypothetical protein
MGEWFERFGGSSLDRRENEPIPALCALAADVAFIVELGFWSPRAW